MSSVKRKLSVKSLDEKCQALRDLEKSLSNKDVAEKYGVPRNTILTWKYHFNTKSEYFAALEQSSNKRKKPRSNDYKRVDHVCWSFCKNSNHCMCMTQLENNLAFWLILTENKIPITVKMSIYFLSPVAFRLTKVNTEVNIVLGLPNAL